MTGASVKAQSSVVAVVGHIVVGIVLLFCFSVNTLQKCVAYLRHGKLVSCISLLHNFWPSPEACLWPSWQFSDLRVVWLTSAFFPLCLLFCCSLGYQKSGHILVFLEREDGLLDWTGDWMTGRRKRLRFFFLYLESDMVLGLHPKLGHSIS